MRWLRPEYQVPRFGREIEAEPEVVPPRRDGARAVGEAPRVWPQRLVEQLGVLQELLAAEPVTAEGAAGRFAANDLMRLPGKMGCAVRTRQDLPGKRWAGSPLLLPEYFDPGLIPPARAFIPPARLSDTSPLDGLVVRAYLATDH